MKKGNDIMYDMPLPDAKLEKGKYVATIRYQIPRRLLLNARTKTSPKFETLYGIIYWLNKQPYHMEYFVYKTDKEGILKQGFKKLGDTIK
jgi:hypothetical protein